MFAEARLHAHAHGRPSLRNLVQKWNIHRKKRDSTLHPPKWILQLHFGSLEESKLIGLQDAAKKPIIEILPLGMALLYGPNPGQSN
ncbi:Hypothetical predicted protein [Olea europaea subsp. europaea]|uniref:Uncharacterized protein n=1 Tax=Olea europaea subsp. europaea TaxID=158383 RepID=A0A8S0U1G4_OLEEU|nr:Hypothetical predicted protein [Olea europaea subsp. europaea]